MSRAEAQAATVDSRGGRSLDTKVNGKTQVTRQCSRCGIATHEIASDSLGEKLFAVLTSLPDSEFECARVDEALGWPRRRCATPAELPLLLAKEVADRRRETAVRADLDALFELLGGEPRNSDPTPEWDRIAEAANLGLVHKCEIRHLRSAALYRAEHYLLRGF